MDGGAVACGFSAATLLARVIATHMDGICPFHRDAEGAVWGLSSPGGQSGRESFPGGFLLALRLLRSVRYWSRTFQSDFIISFPWKCVGQRVTDLFFFGDTQK